MFGTNTLLNMAALLFAGLLFSRLIKLLKLPNVTGFSGGRAYHRAPSVLGLLSAKGVESLNLVSSVALGFIAFSIGSEFKISYFRRVGFLPIVIAVFESLFAVVFVVAALGGVGAGAALRWCWGAIAAGYGAGGPIMVIKQYKARGPVTETLLSVVALDDATALIFFGIAVAIAQALESPQHASLLASMAAPVLQIFEALGIGLVLGAVQHRCLSAFCLRGTTVLRSPLRLCYAATAVADMLGLSALLTTMAMGAVFANFCRQSAQVMEVTDRFTNPIYMMFFCAVRRGAEPFHPAFHRAGRHHLCGGARAGQAGGRLVRRRADARARGCAPLPWPGAFCRRRALPLALPWWPSRWCRSMPK